MSSKYRWDYRGQLSTQMIEVDKVGAALSMHLPCKTVRYPAFEKNMFECLCGMVIPLYMAKAAIVTKDWSMVEELHTKGVKGV